MKLREIEGFVQSRKGTQSKARMPNFAPFLLSHASSHHQLRLINSLEWREGTTEHSLSVPQPKISSPDLSKFISDQNSNWQSEMQGEPRELSQPACLGFPSHLLTWTPGPSASGTSDLMSRQPHLHRAWYSAHRPTSRLASQWQQSMSLLHLIITKESAITYAF